MTTVTEKVTWVERKPTVCFGKPVIKGTRIPIAVLLGALADGMTVPEVAEAYQIPTEAVKAALAYAVEQIKVALLAVVEPSPDMDEVTVSISRQRLRRILKALARAWM